MSFDIRLFITLLILFLFTVTETPGIKPYIYFFYFSSNWTGATSGVGLAYPSRAPQVLYSYSIFSFLCSVLYIPLSLFLF